MSFSVIFAIIAGIAILFLAIYATMRFVNTGKDIVYVEAAKSIDNYLGNLVTGIAEGVSREVSFRKETRVFFNCSYPSPADGIPFGKEIIGFSEKSGIGDEWYDSKTRISRNNKFIFANEILQGKDIHIFIKPFYMGFKVDDLIMMSSQNYCFASNNMPANIQNDIENLNMENVVVSGSCVIGTENITVCFGNSGCDITVTDYSGTDSYEIGSVAKPGEETVKYVGNLLYGAIFSSPEVYKCNVARLGVKTAELANVYYKKISIVGGKCPSTIGDQYLRTLEAGFDESNLIGIYQTAKTMDSINEGAMCKIYPGETYGNI